MHIPDGFLDTKTAAVSGAIAILGVGMASRYIHRHLSSKRIPLIGLAAAFIFAAQMLNFPVAGGTSGHLIGATLIAVLLGPSAAILVMSSVLILQCLMFADGGLTALGANIFNMGIVASFTGYIIYSLIFHLLGDNLRSRLTAIAFASWCSTVLAAIACSAELAISGTARWGIIIPAMVGVHMLIGIGEAIITTLAVSAIIKIRPELLDQLQDNSGRSPYGQLAVYGLLISIGFVIFLAPVASVMPDGLEKVAESIGLMHTANPKTLIASPIPDYQIPGIKSPSYSTMLAGLIGTIVAFGLSLLLARLLTPSHKMRHSQV
jgi:cobalt/nickel transport system permease protein